MRTIRRVLLGGLALVTSLYFVHAQTAQSSADDLTTMVEAIEQTTPEPASDVLAVGNFYSTQHLPGTENAWPPLPGNMWNLPVWSLGDGQFLLDDTNVDYVELQAEAEAAAALAAPASPMTRMSMLASSLASYAYNNQVYLTNLTASLAYDGSMTANFNIAGGTNFVPYDILMSTNVATPVPSWNWIGLGYTSNNYTFYEQPADMGFYILAKPSKTMTIAWGDDSSGQCDVPPGLTNPVQVAGGAYHSIALLNDGSLVAWGDNTYGQTNIPAGLTNAVVVVANGYHNLALRADGTLAIWGDWYGTGFYTATLPSGLTNIAAVAAGLNHDLAVDSNGTVTAWSYYTSTPYTQVPTNLPPALDVAAGISHSVALLTNGTVVAWGQDYDSLGWDVTNVPAGLSNVVAIAAGEYHTLALKADGTVVAWGAGNTNESPFIDEYGQSTVPAGLSNVVAIAAGGFHSLALKRDGTVVMWGDLTTPEFPLNQIIGIGSGWYHALALRTGNTAPLLTSQPADQYAIAGGTAGFSVSAIGLAALAYQWQSNGVAMSGATNSTLTLTNVQAAQEGVYGAVVTDSGSGGSIASSNANFYLVTPPVITYQSTPTNQVCIYGNVLSFAATVSAPGQTNGFPLFYQWQFNGTNITGATTTNYSFTVNDTNGGTYSLIVSNAAGSTNANWLVTVTNAINVTNDLLLVYNSNSADSSNLCAYYLAHRPLVAGANVLGIGCDVGEFTTSTNCNDQIVAPVLNWLTNNPTKRPQYVILFYDIPTRLTDLSITTVPTYFDYGSVGYHLHILRSDWQPFVTYINGGTLADCEAYVDKVANFGTNYSPGKLIISASAGGYGNTNYVLDGIRHGAGYSGFENYSSFDSVVALVTNGLIAAGVPTSNILFSDGTEIISNSVAYNLPHPTGVTNVAGYICWGAHSSLGGNYPIDGTVQWKGNSGWWLIRTLESYNGQKADPGQGNFVKWFSSNAFGGTNYSNTPIGASSNVEEPGLEESTTTSAYFSLWASGENFGVCVWNARNTVYFQAVGDPFVTK